MKKLIYTTIIMLLTIQSFGGSVKNHNRFDRIVIEKNTIDIVIDSESIYTNCTFKECEILISPLTSTKIFIGCIFENCEFNKPITFIDFISSTTSFKECSFSNE